MDDGKAGRGQRDACGTTMNFCPLCECGTVVLDTSMLILRPPQYPPTTIHMDP